MNFLCKNCGKISDQESREDKDLICPRCNSKDLVLFSKIKKYYECLHCNKPFKISEISAITLFRNHENPKCPFCEGGGPSQTNNENEIQTVLRPTAETPQHKNSNFGGDILKIDLPETDYCGIAPLSIQAHYFLNESETRIGVSVYQPPQGDYFFRNKNDIPLSNPISLQIDPNIQSDCHDGANINIKLERNGASYPPPHYCSIAVSQHGGWDVKKKSFFYLSSPPSIPFLRLFKNLKHEKIFENISNKISEILANFGNKNGLLQKSYKNTRKYGEAYLNRLQKRNSNIKNGCNSLLHFFAIFYIRISIW